MSAPKPNLKSLNILLVDDHLNMRRLWSAILKGFRLRTLYEAGTATEALEQIKSLNIDLVIVDQILPDLKGSELIHLIRMSDDSVEPMIPIIACTADSRKPVIYELLNAGADEILTKPVSPQAVWQRLVAITTKRREFVRTPTYFGPDRRRAHDPKYRGPERRQPDEDELIL